MPGRFSKDHLWQLAGGERAFERREEYIEAECIPWTYWRHQLLKQVEFCSFRAFSFHSHLADRGSAIAALELKPFLEKVFVAWPFYCCFSG